MDSGGSGSLQSSSGGDDQEYDSRVDHHSISSFLNPSATHFSIHPQPPPAAAAVAANAPFFDPSLDSSHFSVSHTQQNPLYNDPLWSRNLIRSDPTTYTDFVNQSLLGGSSQQSGLSTQQNPFPGPSSSTAARAPTQQPDHHQLSNVAAAAQKNPKKRTRASRRAPTTVLTTDTSNFRQMVQEFTGIPAAPFSAASSSFSRRFDLFGGGGGGGSAMGLGPLYPLRPTAQKLQLSPQFLTNNSNSPSSFLNSDATAAATAAPNITNNFQQQTNSDHSFQKQPQTLLNLQNPLFTFQSLLQQNTNAATFASQKNTSMNNNDNTLDGQQVNSSLGGFPSSSSSAATTRRWSDHHGGDEGQNLGGFDGNSQNVGGYKLNNSSSFQSDKGLDNIVSTSRGTTDHQGNVDSWICPSD